MVHQLNSTYMPLATYIDDGITWCIQSARIIPRWENVFHAVKQRELIAYVLLTFVLVTICFYFLTSLNYLDYDYITVLLKCMLAILNAAPNWNMTRSHTRIVIFFGIWTGMLTHIIMIHFYIVFINKTIYGHQIATQHELVDNNYQLAGSELSLELIKHGTVLFSNDIIERYRICTNIDLCLMALANDNRLAVAISRMHTYQNHTRRNVSMDSIYCFDKNEQIIQYPMMLMMATNNNNRWAFDRIQRLAQLAMQGGLFVKWLKDYPSFRHLGNRRRHSDANGESQVQTIEHIIFAFMIYLLVISMAFVAFAIECIVYRRSRCRGVHRYWKLADILVDGKRHFFLPIKKQNPRIRYG